MGNNEEYIIECGCGIRSKKHPVDSRTLYKSLPAFCGCCGKKFHLRSGKAIGIMVCLEEYLPAMVSIDQIKNLIEGKEVDYEILYF